MYTALVRSGYTTSINLFFLILYISDISDPFIFPQTLNIQTDGGKKSLTFIPLAPACVVSTNLSLSLSLPFPFAFFVIYPLIQTPLVFQKRNFLMNKGTEVRNMLCVEENGVYKWLYIHQNWQI